MDFLHTKKFRHGSLSVGITILVIAAVIILNVAVTALTQTYLWYVDMTPEPRFTLSDEAKAILHGTEEMAGMDTSKKVEIIFCDEEDKWSHSETLQLQVWMTAREIQQEFPDSVSIVYKDIYTNPTSVEKYHVETGKVIDRQTVIITSGTEYRVYNLQDFYMLGDDGQTVIGYDGEQRYVSALLSVTRAEAPKLWITTNHGETYDPALKELFLQLGFEVEEVNLATKQQIDKDCRLILVSDPQYDFLEKNAQSDVSEIEMLDKFLAANNSLIVLFDKNTPNNLYHFDQFLAEWGIEVARTANKENYVILDKEHSLTVDGRTNQAMYDTGAHLGADVTAPLRQNENPKPVYFPNTTALRFSSLYQVTNYDGYQGASYTANGVVRDCYNVFTSHKGADAMVNGEVVTTAITVPFSYMMLSCQTVMDDKTGVASHSFVLASASTDFASALALGNSGYGNRSVLAYACNTMGSLVVPVSLDCKFYASMEITSMTASEANQYTVVFAVVPATIVFVAGIYVMVRRKRA